MVLETKMIDIIFGKFSLFLVALAAIELICLGMLEILVFSFFFSLK